jgi:hypothetical protein
MLRQRDDVVRHTVHRHPCGAVTRACPPSAYGLALLRCVAVLLLLWLCICCCGCCAAAAVAANAAAAAARLARLPACEAQVSRMPGALVMTPARPIHLATVVMRAS